MPTFKDDFIEANGIRQHYWRTGNRTKPALVLCHGITDNGLCWTPVARALEADYDVIMLDARGHGLSDAPESGYATADLAADLAAFIHALDLEKPAVLGHSMGGATVSYTDALPHTAHHRRDGEGRHRDAPNGQRSCQNQSQHPGRPHRASRP